MMKTIEKQTNKQFDLIAYNLDEAMRIADILSKSNLVPVQYRNKPNDIFVAVQRGADLGLKPLQSLEGISVINGVTTVWGDTMLAIVLAHPHCEDIIETFENGVATCTVKRKGMSPHTRTFSIEDAKMAGLYGKKGSWSTHRPRMLQLKSRNFSLRDRFADALKGIQIREIADEFPDERIIDASVIEETQNMSNSEKIRKELQSRVEKTVEKENANDEQQVKHEENQKEIDYPILLNKIINEKQVPPAIWSPWLSKAKVSSISELDSEQAKKCIDFLEKKYFDEKTGEVFDAKNFMEQ